MQKHSVTIIGAGPSGIAAAIQLKRQCIPFKIFEKDVIGGLLLNANWVENYPGFPKGVSGKDLVQYFREHLNELNIDVHHQFVKKVKWENNHFHSLTENGSYISTILIMASGTKPKPVPDINIAPESLAVIHSEVATLLNERNKSITIIGGGDAAFDYALNLSKKNRVTICCRRDNATCLPLLWKRSAQDPNITFLPNVKVKSIQWEKRTKVIYSQNNGKGRHLTSDHVIFAIGREPNLQFLDISIKNQIDDLLQKKHLYFIGDVRNGQHRQTAIAVGDGLRAAMEVNALWRLNNS